MTKLQFLGALNRTAGYAFTGYISALAAHRHLNALSVGLKTGLVIGLVTGIASTCMSAIEWGADHVPEKSMGVVGLALILIGFALQSLQYWAVLLDVSIRS